MRTLLIIFVIAVQAAAYTVEVDLDDLRIEETGLGTLGSFDSVWIEGELTLPTEPGSPALPGYSVSLTLPQGTVIEEVNVTYAEPAELPGTYNLMPMQKPQPIGTEPEYTAPNEAIYSSSSPFPGDIAYSHNSGNRSGYHVGNIVFAPVQYIPATGKVTIYTSISFDVTLNTAEGELVYPKIRLKRIDEQVRRDLEKAVINPGEIVPPAGMEIIGGYDGYKDDVYPYLIISGSTSTSSLDDLVEWKTRKGNKAEIKTVSEINSEYSGTDTEEKIRNCIIDYYTNYGTQYILLVGTNSNLPMRYAYDPDFNVSEANHLVPTDDYYGCLDGDWNADGDGYWGEYPDDNVDFNFDIYIGRFQAYNSSYTADIVDKTLCYEGTNLSSLTNPYDYDDRALLAGAYLDASTNTGITMDYIEDNYLTGSFWTTEVLKDTSYYGSNFSASRFKSEMNEGRNFIAHSAHSNSTVLGTNSGGVYSSNLEALTNGPRFTGCLYTLGCYSGRIETNNNCAASFVRNDDGGGAGYVGNTRYGWYGPGDPHGWSARFLEDYFEEIGDGVAGSAEAYVEHKHQNIGLMNNDYWRYIYFELYLTGDPDLHFNNDTVSPLTVTYVNDIPQGSYPYDVHVGSSKANVAGAMVCLWKGEEIYDCGLTDKNGDVTFDIDPASQGTMYLTVTVRNFETFEADVNVTNETGINLAYFEGYHTKKGVNLKWEAVNDGSESYTYNLYRRDKSENRSLREAGANRNIAKSDNASLNNGWTRVNGQPISGENPYSYLDTGVSEGRYEYMLEAISDMSEETLGTTNVFVNAPRVYALYQSRPNPAGEVATIAFNLAVAGHTTLEVFDITGRKVMTLADESLPEGEHARTVSGIASGVYLYRLHSGDFTATKKMVIK